MWWFVGIVSGPVPSYWALYSLVIRLKIPPCDSSEPQELNFLINFDQQLTCN